MDKNQISQLCKGRTAEQQKVIRYFLGGGGCLSSSIKDEDYDAMVQAVAKGTDFRQKALNKIGLDESELKEIEPVHFEGFRFERGHAKAGKDRLWRSTMYQVSWIFFSATQVYVYQYNFHMDEDGKKEATEEYFYKDITAFSTSSDTVEKEVLEKVNCKGDATYKRTNVETNLFALVVPGDKLCCSMEKNDYTERSIQAMKAKLREKKNA